MGRSRWGVVGWPGGAFWRASYETTDDFYLNANSTGNLIMLHPADRSWAPVFGPFTTPGVLGEGPSFQIETAGTYSVEIVLNIELTVSGGPENPLRVQVIDSDDGNNVVLESYNPVSSGSSTPTLTLSGSFTPIVDNIHYVQIIEPDWGWNDLDILAGSYIRISAA